ncbi:MAG: phosphoribosylformylglycinamidine synthase subunit PurQ, partial [Pseudomonadota bacterium]
MCAAGFEAQDYALYETVRAVGMEFCPALGINIPVGKDSMSMQTNWRQGDDTQQCVSPLSLIVSAFAPVIDVNQSLTPQIEPTQDTVLLLFDLGKGHQRLGGSILEQTLNTPLGEGPDCDDPSLLKTFFTVVQMLNDAGYLLAYHDRSDGGLIAALIEMALAGRVGLDIEIPSASTNELFDFLFCEELGAIVQIRAQDLDVIRDSLDNYEELRLHVTPIATCNAEKSIRLLRQNAVVSELLLSDLAQSFLTVTHQMQRLRDNPECASEEFRHASNMETRGLFLEHATPIAPYIGSQRPSVAVLREQGVNGHVEMAAAFDYAGFEAIDVHMTDILSGHQDLQQCSGLVACGGFSYGDVLGAGRGWAASIKNNSRAQTVFRDFFARNTTFTLGVCNGCQMLAQLADMIPGADDWPVFERNTSEQFEARLAMVEVLSSNSIFFTDMQGQRSPIVVAHGEGRATTAGGRSCALRYIDDESCATERFPFNPNGSPQGATGFSSADGRALIMMPHPERVFLTQQFSWLDPAWRTPESPWMGIFRNARHFVD